MTRRTNATGAGTASPAIALLGSGEFLPWAEPIDRWLLERSRTGSDRVVILPTASAPEGDDVFDNWARMGLEHYGKLGAQPEVLQVRTREDAFRLDLASRIRGAAVVYVSGGNPGYLCKTLAGTPCWDAVLAAMAEGTSYGGCSAGACSMGALVPDIHELSDLRPEMWGPGLAYFPQVEFGPHWDVIESYIPGLTEFILRNVPPGCLMVAIDEETAILSEGGPWRVEGRGAATLLREGIEEGAFRAGEAFELPR